ncbi:MAG: SDR family oxidoreductase [Clostridiales Family XIII bacterium]|jgi:NAD(P)-dependent dehydrogenase (short-subunit alcohol dehydrogenase family)|nr:SDR family oxidoreductase [Clostridiales Family XIII bacterium]
MSEFFKTKPIGSMDGAYSVKGFNVVVTGGNRGIGKGISTAFAQSGANVVILCRNQESGQAVADSFAQYGGRYACFRCDIADFAEVQEAAKQVYAFFDYVDVLVNNAGVATTTDFLEPDKGLSEWHRVINTNLHGVANVVNQIVPKMRDSGRGGEVINISSVGGLRVSGSKDHHNSPYNASKAGVDIFSRYLANTLGDYGIRVNSIQPGPIHSDLDKDLPPSFIEVIEKELPVHRFGEPIEVGALAVYLSSPAGAMITGANIPFDGGLLTVH